jgi:hypothetical protein
MLDRKSGVLFKQSLQYINLALRPGHVQQSCGGDHARFNPDAAIARFGAAALHTVQTPAHRMRTTRRSTVRERRIVGACDASDHGQLTVAFYNGVVDLRDHVSAPAAPSNLVPKPGKPLSTIPAAEVPEPPRVRDGARINACRVAQRISCDVRPNCFITWVGRHPRSIFTIRPRTAPEAGWP